MCDIEEIHTYIIQYVIQNYNFHYSKYNTLK